MTDERESDPRRGQDAIVALAVVAFVVAAGAGLAWLVLDGSLASTARTVFVVASSVWLLLVVVFVGTGGARTELESGDPVRAAAFAVGAAAFAVTLVIGLVQAIADSGVLDTARSIGGAVVAACFVAAVVRRTR